MPAITTTDLQEEMLTEVDSTNNVIGPIPRGIAHSSPDRYYRTIAVFVRDATDKFLWQKRSLTKDLYPDCWDFSVGGHVGYGRSYQETASAELEEELAIIASTADLRLLGEVLVKLPAASEFFQVFEYKLKPDDKIEVDEAEVSATKWMTMEQAKQSIREHESDWYPRPIQIIRALY